MGDTSTFDSCKIMVVAGEASGDLHGANLLREIKESCPNAEIFGIGGARMARERVELFYSIEQMAFLGFVEVIRHLPFVRRVLSEMKDIMAHRRPDILILIDYPGFNLRLAKMAYGYKIPVMYYISPQIWAWGRSRIAKIRKWVTRMVVIFPFEHEMYRKQGLAATFVGHPLLDIVQPTMTSETFRVQHKIKSEVPVIGLLPGSRVQEVARLLPVMVQAGKRIQRKTGNAHLVIGAAETLEDTVYHRALGDHSHSVTLVRNATYDVMKHADLLLVASGTATLESAILGTPMIVLYKVAPLSYVIAHVLLDIPYIGLVNVVAGRKVVPEFIQGNAEPGKIAATAVEILKDSSINAEMRTNLSQIAPMLGQKGASKRAAETAIEMIAQVHSE